MITLGLDTATGRAGAALLDGDRVFREAREGPAPSGAILPMIDALLARAGRSMEDLDRIAVAIGPGSFTGLRVGIATVRGLVAPLSAPPGLAAVSTLAAIRRAARLAGRFEEDAVALLPYRKGEWSVGFPDGREEIRAEADLPPNPSLAGWEEYLAEAVARLGAEAPPVEPAALQPNYLKAPYGG